MAEPRKESFCTYTSVKIDADCLLIARAAAAISGKRMQDWLSDLVNEHGSSILNRGPITRKKPPPHKKGRPKKRKSSDQ